MSDLIRKQQALNALRKLFKESNYKKEYFYAIDAVEDVPSAEPKKGKWKRLVGGTKQFGTTVMYRCSECEELSISQYFFCPHCGAKMGVME